MPYVMVPVPEEYVEDVMQYVLRAVARASIEEWDAPSIASVFAEIDEPSRSLLSFLARSMTAGNDLTEADAAAMMQLNAREVAGIMRELNDLAREANHPPLLTSRIVTETLPNGRTREKRVLTMAEDVTGFVRDAERADMLSEAQPSGAR